MKSLRSQTLAYLLALLAVIGVVSYLTANEVMNRSLGLYEDKIAAERFERVKQAVSASALSLQRSATANAVWDDALAYINSEGDVTHLRDNYQRNALDETYGIDLVLYIRPDGSVHSYVDGRPKGEPLFVSGTLPEFGVTTESFRQGPDVIPSGGYLLRLLNGQPIVLSFERITASDPDPAAPHAGWLAMGRLLDHDGVADIRTLSGAEIEIFSSLRDVSTLPEGMSSEPLSDTLGLSPVTLAVDAPPSMSGQRSVGQNLMVLNTLVLIVLAALFAAILMDRLILRRLADFSRRAEAQQALESGEEPIVWPVKGDDELDTLAVSLNSLVDNLRQAETTLRNEQAEIIDAKRKLEVANRMKDTFLATISHELRTPMNGIIGAYELLRSSAPSPYQKECLDTLRESSTHMLSMVERILLFSELQSGAVRTKAQTIEINQWSDLMSRVWSIIFRHKKLPFHFSCENIIEPWISVDAGKIDQFIQEVLRNAEKFTTDGQVDMKLGQERSGDTLYLTFEVRDTGNGIAAERLDNIVESFRRSEGRYNRSYGGLGIGLAITKEIVRVMNGEWSIHSDGEGKGTVVKARIPVEKAEPLVQAAPVVPEAASAAPGRLAPGRILLVEDNPVNQKVMIKILEMLGWPYKLAENGEEAVKCASEEAYALILMDCQMPVMDGLEATKVIRATHNPNQFTPIIAVTANVSDLDRDNCMAVGMNAFLPKPVKPAVIKETISSWASAAKKA